MVVQRVYCIQVLHVYFLEFYLSFQKLTTSSNLAQVCERKKPVYAGRQAAIPIIWVAIYSPIAYITIAPQM
jgi:tryptophan-rich sensory protein